MSSPHPPPPHFVDRPDAGHALARALARWSGAQAQVFGVPPGGVDVAATVARELGLPFRCAAVRPIELRDPKGFVIGAVDADGSATFDPARERAMTPLTTEIDAAVALARARLEHLSRRLPRVATRPALGGNTAIVIDEALVVPAVAVAAIGWVRNLGARYVVFATPIAPRRAAAAIKPLVDQLVILETDEELADASDRYALLPPASDADVEAIFARA